MNLENIWRVMIPVAVLVPFALVTLSTSVLEPFEWEKRPIIVFGADGDPRIDEQMMLFSEAAVELEDRRNVVIVETDPDSDLWKHYRPDGFTVILVGLDGGEKFRNGAVTDPDDLNDLIDRMPMRRNELLQRWTEGGN
ncbi:MAG: DUF4174 domain-containing protein [Pseudomonadota bacterium]